jgi:hypothetical protein
MTYIQYLVLVFAYESLILFSSAPFILLLSLSESLTNGPIGYIRAAIKVGVLFWVFGGFWIAHNAARRHVFQGEGFVEAIGSAFAEGRIAISFLPVIGRLFSVRSRKSSPFDRPDDPTSL